MMYDYNTCILGAGPAGFAAAMRARDLGRKVALVERSRVGGAGLHNGVLASKTLWELSRDYCLAVRSDRGYQASDVEVDFESVVSVVETAIREKQDQIENQLEACSPGSDRGEGKGCIELIRGNAQFLNEHTLQIANGETVRTITAENFVLATGSRPRIVDDIPVDGKVIMTSDHVMNLEAFPKSIVILGAGVVGCEYATILANFGKTRVYLIDRADRILPFEDADISRVCTKNFEAQGVTIHHGAQLASMKVHEGQVRYTLQYSGGGVETIDVERALVSIGRTPNTDDLGLENCGVKLDERGFIPNEDTRTNAVHIYAVGDITRDVALANVAEREGIQAIDRICGVECDPISYDNLSTIMFLDPEVAAVGMNELEAQRSRIPYRVAVYDYSVVSRAIAMRATEGFVKVLVSDDDDARILGMRALGAHASTTIEAVSLMIRHGMHARELADLIHPHPAITEAVQECLRMILGRSIYKPDVFRKRLRLSRVCYDPEGCPSIEA